MVKTIKNSSAIHALVLLPVVKGHQVFFRIALRAGR